MQYEYTIEEVSTSSSFVYCSCIWGDSALDDAYADLKKKPVFRVINKVPRWVLKKIFS